MEQVTNAIKTYIIVPRNPAHEPVRFGRHLLHRRPGGAPLGRYVLRGRVHQDNLNPRRLSDQIGVSPERQAHNLSIHDLLRNERQKRRYSALGV